MSATHACSPQVRYDRYMAHVRRLETEVAAARAHADQARRSLLWRRLEPTSLLSLWPQAASELATHHRAAATAERSLAALEQVWRIL